MEPGSGSRAQEPAPRELRIGVTGHRHLADPAAVSSAVDAALDRLLGGAEPSESRSGVPPGARPVVVVSPLAEGADRLVAERVLARPGSSLEVLLPLEAEDYETDFGSASSVAQFRSLLSAARSVEVIAGVEPGRTAAYERVGQAVADGCDVLLALWDGEASGGRGGTAEIVHYARARGVPVETIAVRRGST